MNAPLYQHGLFGESTSLVIALVIGLGFGFVLERAGFGSGRKLAAQFYLTDLTVFKVMFTAIVTAMIGLYLLSRIGLLDLSLVYRLPTYLVPQLVGGLLFGVGFVIGEDHRHHIDRAIEFECYRCYVYDNNYAGQYHIDVCARGFRYYC